MQIAGLRIGHYRLVQLIGRGGMGDVYLAEDEHFSRQVALKTMHHIDAPIPTDPDKLQEALRLFKREAQAIARLNHRHILPLHEYGETEIRGTRVTYMVMPFCQDGSLETWLRQRNTKSPLSLSEAIFLLEQAADALQATHDHHIIHRDVKPSNFLIRYQITSALPDLLLADFGTAAIMDATTSMGQVVRGTPAYMAPEQWEGKETTYATDQYALAIMAYELLTGQLPFQGNQFQLMHKHLQEPPDPPSSLVPSLPESVDAVILQALAKSPKDRFARIYDFVLALKQPGPLRLESTEAIVKFSAVSPAPPPLPKRKWPLVLMGVLAFLLIVVSSVSALALNSYSNALSQSTATAQAAKAVQIRVQLTATAQILANNSTATAQVLANNVTATAWAKANNATATAQARVNINATATAQAQANYHATATAQAQVYYRDALTDPNNTYTRTKNWENDANCSFQSDGYHVLQNTTPGQIACQESEGLYGNADISVDMNILNGHSGGLFFRFDKGGFGGSYNGYLFEIDSTGEYKISSWSSSSERTLQDWTPSAAFKQGSKNTLRVILCSNNFSFYINGMLLAHLTDNANDHPDSSSIALAAIALNSPTEVVYSNLKVSASSC